MSRSLYNRGRRFLYPLDKRLVGPRAGRDAVARRKISSPCQELNPVCPAHSLVYILTELLRLSLTKFTIAKPVTLEIKKRRHKSFVHSPEEKMF
jgi:hypothetical protein